MVIFSSIVSTSRPNSSASLLLHRFHFSGQTLQLAFKLLLFRFILLGKFQKSLVCQLTRNVILIGALNQHIQFIISPLV